MAGGVTRTVLLIRGMRDNACRERVAEALGRVPGVVETSVSLIRARVVVTHLVACEPEQFVNAVHEAGYIASLREQAAGTDSRRRASG